MLRATIIDSAPQVGNRMKSLLIHLLVLGAGLCGAPGAFALVGGPGVAPNTADSPWAGVGSLKVGNAYFTGTLIAPGYVLTAAHVVAGQNPSALTFQLNAGASSTFAASAIFVNPDYTGTASGNLPGDPTAHDDIAIVRLSGDVAAGIPVYDRYGGNLLGRNLSFVSYAGSPTVKTIGENRADLLIPDPSGTDEVYLFDFDGPDLTTNRIGQNVPANGTLGADREASLIGGDSGSAAFVFANGAWQLAGINTFRLSFAAGPAEAGLFGTGGGGIILSAYTPWINGVIANPVPEPDTVPMLLAGLGVLAFLVRRKKAADAMLRTNDSR